MQRRNFIKNIAAGSMAAVTLGIGSKTDKNRSEPKKQVMMKLGCQSGGMSDSNLAFKARHGVYHFDPGSPGFIEGVGWDLDHSLKIVEAASKYGISIDSYHLPLSSAGIAGVSIPHIMLGKSPERDREIEMIWQMIEVSAKSGVKTLLYNTVILPILRTGRTLDPSRGNASYSTWNYEDAVRSGMDQKRTIAGDVDIDELYERIIYLLDRIIPVAEEYNVRLGNHIADPPLPSGFQGVTRWNSPDVFEGIRRFANLYDSPVHGFNLCIGSVAEGLKDPKNEIESIIRWIGERNQIFNVHLRNIKGGWGHFYETYPDNGDINFIRVMRTLRDVGYNGMVMPDHVPRHEDPESGRQAFAFAYGYIRALIQMLEDEAQQAYIPH